MIDEAEEARPDNLFEPVPGDFGAHGPYAEGNRDSPFTWANEHGGNTLLRAAGALAALCALGLALTAVVLIL